MARLNRARFLRNIAEAREQLEDIEQRLASRERLSEVKLQILMEHAYHHLNWAWNTRNVSSAEYDDLTDRKFNSWARVPKEIQALEINLRRGRGGG